MCHSPLKSALNPNAQEWRPCPLKLPPLPQTSPLLNNPYCFPHGFFSFAAGCSNTQFLTYYPPAAAAAPIPLPLPPSYGSLYREIGVSKGFCGGSGFPVDDFMSCGENVGAPKKINGRFRRILPPRLRGARKPFVKKEWRPVKPPSPVRNEVKGGGNSSPASSPDEFSDASNTTVMMRNIPNKLRRGFLLKFLDEHCKSYSLEYDFLYLPMDFRKDGNLGYAFVNFTSTSAAVQFRKVFGNYKWQMVYTQSGPITSKKVGEVTWARIQGKEALIRRFKNSSFCCDNMEFLPVVLDPPRNGSDPDPSPPRVLGKLHPRNY